MRRSVVVAALLLLVIPGVTPAQEHPNLGTVQFQNSGAAEAQDAFIRGVLLLHSFEYEDALTAFVEARELDSDFAMAYWGEAMTHNHPLWGQQDRDAAVEALARFAPTPAERRARVPTEREQMYFDALETLYGDGDKRERDGAYMDAMGRLRDAYPDDDEAQAFYALSILGSVPSRDYAVYMKAGAAAEEVFAANPRHPGALHYMIHSYDDPVHAPLGVRAAREYARIAPAASHAQHMISHIYTALGSWDEVITANATAVEVSEERLRRMGRSLAGRSHHALYWLEYGLLQQGRFDEARSKLEIMGRDAAETGDRASGTYAQMRATYIVANPTRGDAPAAPETTPGRSANLHAFADGLAAAAAGDLDEATRNAESIAAYLSEQEADGGRSDIVAKIFGLQLQAILAFQEGRTATAFELMETAVRDEEARPVAYGPPSIVKPSRELFGELLLAAGRADDAMEQFEASLERAPRRTLSVVGLARAAEEAGDAEAAAAAWELAGEIWKGSEVELRGAGMPWMETTASR